MSAALAAALAAASIASESQGAFVGLALHWTPVTIGGVNFLRWTIAAQFDGPTDTVLAVTDLATTGGPASYSVHADAIAVAAGGAVPTNIAGTWNPRAVLSDAGLAAADSYVTIGGVAGSGNSTQPDADWLAGGDADLRGWDRPDLPNNGAIGWFNAAPSNLQGRVGNSPGLASHEVRLMEVTRLCGFGLPIVAVTLSYTDGQPGSAVQVATAGIPLGGAPPAWYRDLDGDGFGASASGVVYELCPGAGFVASNDDCDDGDAAVNPATVWFRDIDADGFGAAADGTAVQCLAPPGYARLGGDNCPSIADPSQTDCDADGIGDVCEVSANPRLDVNRNGRLDACERARGDLDLDGAVGVGDVAVLLGLWGSAGVPFGDLSGDGIVAGADLAILLNNWGALP